jgi:hypothetical protein
LQAAILHFYDPVTCLNYLALRRYSKVVVRVTCGPKEVTFLPFLRVSHCKTRHARSQFSVKVGTIFEDSPIGLDKWPVAIWMVANCRNGVSSYEIASDLS